MLNKKLTSPQKIASFKGLILWWLLGCGALLTLFFNLLGMYQVIWGIHVKAAADFEQYTLKFLAEQQNTAFLKHIPNLRFYQDKETIPDFVKRNFPAEEIKHNEVLFTASDDDDSPVPPAIRQQLFSSACDMGICRLVFFYSYRIEGDNWLYFMQGVPDTKQLNENKDFVERIEIGVVVAMLLLFILLAYLLIRKISEPVQSLSQWADNLTLLNVEKSPPDFTFKELNSIAIKLSSALQSVASAVKKEQRFLQYASHELRTPIAVASGNIDILKLLNTDEDAEQPQSKALNRLNDAVKDMQQLTETLLWLHREESEQVQSTNVDILALVQQVCEDHIYLIKDKQITLSVIGNSDSLEVQLTLLKIVLANLIRNAFQHTEQGNINIKIDRNTITVASSSCEQMVSLAKTDPTTTNHCLGFGLGLQLIEQICQKLNWQHQVENSDTGYISKLTLN